MGWSLRKSFRLFPGIRVNLSKSGPRVSVGVPGIRASINMQGKTRVYAAKGPVRYQKTFEIGTQGVQAVNSRSRALSALKRFFGGA
jgi:hypothetical protein